MVQTSELFLLELFNSRAHLVFFAKSCFRLIYCYCKFGENCLCKKLYETLMSSNVVNNWTKCARTSFYKHPETCVILDVATVFIVLKRIEIWWKCKRFFKNINKAAITFRFVWYVTLFLQEQKRNFVLYFSNSCL